MSYKFIGREAGDQAGISVSSIGDIDGDGKTDFIIGAYKATVAGEVRTGESYLLFSGDLGAMDAADGTSDGVIDLENINLVDGSGFTGYQFDGYDAVDEAGTSVSSTGDVDGDGIDDLLIGAPRALGGGGNTGETYLLFSSDFVTVDAADGTTDGVISLENTNTADGGGFTGYQFNGTEATDFAGFDATSAGDVDGDGLGDLLIGAYQADGGGTNSGEAYLVLGSDLADMDAADGSIDGVIDLDNANIASGGGFAGYQFIGTQNKDAAGKSISSAGDIDGDGLDDLLISAIYADDGGPSAGEAYLLFGADLADMDAADGSIDGVVDLDNANTATSDGFAGYQFLGTDKGNNTGDGLASVYDINGDGLDDLIIGAEIAAADSDRGEIYLMFGSDLADMDAADGSTDGVIDLENVNTADGSGFTGYEFIASGLTEHAGYSVAGTGDANGDGIGDILIGANTSDINGEKSGEVFFIRGADLATMDAEDGAIDGIIDLGNINLISGDGFTGYRILGGAAGDWAGDSVTFVDDIDGDGGSELLIGAHFAGGGGTRSGEAYLLQSTQFAELDAADGSTDGVIDLTNANIPCFTFGTRITTKEGPRGIEKIAVGDRVLTLDHGYQTVRWVGSTAVMAPCARLSPIRIAAGALGHGLPERDLLVSRQHRMLLRSIVAERMFGTREVLVAACKLTGLPGVEPVEGLEQVAYFHMLFDRHEIILAEGAPSESLYTGPEALKSVPAEARREIEALFPELLNSPPPQLARPIAEKGRMIQRLVERQVKNGKAALEDTA